MKLQRRQPFNRTLCIGLMLLAVANVVRLLLERHSSLPEGPRDGLFGLLFGIWFAHDTFSVTGTGDFTGTFHLFREQLPNGQTRTGRELKGIHFAMEFLHANTPSAAPNGDRLPTLAGWQHLPVRVVNATRAPRAIQAWMLARSPSAGVNRWAW